MCFGKKNNIDDDEDQAPRPAPGQYPQQRTYAQTGDKVSMPSPPVQAPYQAPQQQQQYAPPAGSPPAELSAGTDFAPPPGPPPARAELPDYTAPPPGPPPPSSELPTGEKRQHDWESVVPDTSLFPPPPDIFSGWDRSPGLNATEQQAEAGEAWCRQHPLVRPVALDAAALAAHRAHSIRLMQPVGFRGALEWADGAWTGKTEKGSPDACVIGYPPLYCVTEDSPLAMGRAKTAYFEVVLRTAIGERYDNTVGIGFTALPYPSFRLPGWHRGSLAVHGDDGHRYVNDRWGGKDFVAPFGARKGETVGIGMTFREVGGRIEGEAFFTRDGKLDGKWDVNEELDTERDLGVEGLQGYHDLSCAIGTFGEVRFDVVFDPARWKYKGVAL
jgi:hypothetical protein